MAMRSSSVALNPSTLRGAAAHAGAGPSARLLFPVVRRAAGGPGDAPAPPAARRDSVSIAQFNILAGPLAGAEYFPYAKPELLRWERRKHTLLAEIKSLRTPAQDTPDILCMEELSNYWDFFKNEMEAIGYDSVYVKRPSLHGTSRSGISKYDGCGIFLKKNRFRLVHEESINFKDRHDRVALLVLLEDLARPDKTKSDYILIANTHLYWDPKKVEDQLSELKEVESGIYAMQKRVKKKYEQSKLPILFCGDFNNTPTSPIYDYLVKQFLQKERKDPVKERTSLRSAYDVYGYLDGDKAQIVLPVTDHGEAPFGGPSYEPEHTTVTSRRRSTIDYIWYSRDHFELTHLLEIPSEEVLRSEEGPEGWIERENQRWLQNQVKEGGPSTMLLDPSRNYNGIPNSVFGSDHLPILAVFDILR